MSSYVLRYPHMKPVSVLLRLWK